MADTSDSEAGGAAVTVDNPSRMRPGNRHDVAGTQIARWLDDRAWSVTQEAPFQFARWIGALLTVVTDWLLAGPSQTAAGYIPVLAVVGLLLLPDARSIGIAGLRFERLGREMEQNRKTMHELSAQVSSISSYLVAGSQVNIVLGSASTATADLPAAGSGEAAGDTQRP